MLTGSEEFMNGGPTKGELMVHGTDTTPLMIETFHSGHFTGADAPVNLAANQVWQKIYGPYFLYVNSGTNSTAIWNDALQRAETERASWPLAWMNEATYPLVRGALTGTLQVDGTAAGNAMLILAQPGSDWQAQGSDYIFWSRADANGTFTIPKVRPGTYSLYAFVPGTSGEMQLPNVVVTAGQTYDLGSIKWTTARLSQTLWQLGTPDRSSAEFRFGAQMRQFGLWWRYMEEMSTNELTYTIGSSTPANWYYAQSVVPMNDNTYFTPKWNISFQVASVPASTAAVVIDLAGAMNSGTFTPPLKVSVNGSLLTTLTPPIGDSGVVRSATRLARYSRLRFEFPSSKLVTGTNTLTLQLNGKSPWSGTTKPVYPGLAVIYDAIRLEGGAAVSESVRREYILTVSASAGGTASGGGSYEVGSVVQISATPSSGYRFVQWSDGSTSATRQVTVNGAATYVASFAQLTAQEAFDQWAAGLPLGNHTFTGDANGDGVANGLEFAFGPLPGANAVLSARMFNGKPTAVLEHASTANGTAYTTLEIQATRNLADWQANAVPLTETTFGSQRAWYAPASEKNVFFRAVLHLNAP